jgi:CBS domain-containing protein
MMNLVSTLLRVKGNVVYTVGPETPVIAALELMAEKKIGAVLVLEDKNIVGVFSERDFVRNVAQNNQLGLDTPVRDLMTTEVFCISPELSIDECMALMTNRRVRHLPVLKEGQLMGLISIGDVVKLLIEDKNLLIANMEKYILGIGYGE